MASKIDRAERRAKRGRRMVKKERTGRFGGKISRRFTGDMETALKEAEDSDFDRGRGYPLNARTQEGV